MSFIETKAVKPLWLFLFFYSLCGVAVASDSSARVGEQVYNRWCAGCHADSPFAPGTIKLKQLRGEANALITGRRDFAADYINYIVRKGLNGMPLFRRTEISKDELNALVKFLSHAKE